MRSELQERSIRTGPTRGLPVAVNPFTRIIHGPLRYGVALITISVVMLLKFAIRPLFADDPPFLLLSAAVMVSAWAGGLGPGLLATLLGTMLAGYFFMEPIHSFVAFGWRTDLPLVVFLLEGAFISWLAEGLRTMWSRSEEGREQFRLLVDGAADHAIFMISPSGEVTSWNVGAERIKGYQADEIFGRHFSCFYTPEDVQAGLPEKVLRTAAVEGLVEVDGWRVRKDGSRFLANVVTTALRDDAGILRGFSKVVRDVTQRRQAEQALAESESMLRAILDTAADAIVTIDARGTICSVNPATERIFGYRAEEMVQHHVSMLMPTPHREQHDQYMRRYLETGEKHIIGIGREVQGQRKDGAIIPLELAVSEVDHLRLFTGLLRDISRRKELEQEVMEVAALEQQRIGQELHDGVGQELTGLALMADALRQHLSGQLPDLARLADRITGGLGRVHQQVRSLSRGLVPVQVDAEGLRAALEEFVTRINEQASVNCAFHCGAPVLVKDTQVATHLFRITQEAVSNALRHGQAHQIDVTLRTQRDMLMLTVCDDGVGIPNDKPDCNGLGIRIMHNRVAAIGGALSIGPANGRGTRLTCTVPLAMEAGENE